MDYRYNNTANIRNPRLFNDETTRLPRKSPLYIALTLTNKYRNYLSFELTSKTNRFNINEGMIEET